MFSLPAIFQNETTITPTGLTYGRWVQGRQASGTGQNSVGWSNDGISWTQSITPNSRDYYSGDFSFQQGLYVFVSAQSNTDNIISSTNGVTWTARSKPNSQPLINVKWCKDFGTAGLWIASGGVNVFTSPNGLSWSTVYTYSTAFGATRYTPNFTNEYTYINGQWTWVSLIGFNNSIGTLPGITVSLISSTNGTTFTERGIITGDRLPRNIRYNPTLNRWLMVNQLAPTRLETISGSPTGSWTHYTITAPSSTRIGLGVGSGYKKSDGTLYTQISATSAQWVAPSFGNLSADGPQWSMTGSTGSEWGTSSVPSQQYNFYGAEYAPEIDQWYLVSASTTLTNGFSSPDGIIWTMRTDFTRGLSLAWGPGVRTTGFNQGAGIT